MEFSKRLKLLLVMGFVSAGVAISQEAPVNPLDTLTSSVEKIQSDLSIWNRLKITGYIQTQYQKADTIGSPAAFSGGNFSGKDANGNAYSNDNRIMVRRGRIKFAYANELSNYVLQFDVTEKGLGIKDAYLSLTDPWTKFFTVTGGVFDRPFGFEIGYSSSSRETPERSRIFQTLFPGERDLGAKLTIQAPKTSNWNFIKLDAGLFNGNGTNVETDKYKDFIGRLSATKTLMNENLSVSGGISYYNGGFAQQTDTVYKMKTVDGIDGFQKSVHSKSKGNQVVRQYYGADLQISLNSIAGITTLRGEYIAGTQPGIASGNTSATALVSENVYSRPISGGYVYFVQSIMQTKWEIVAKYDWYDPNTKLSGNDIQQALPTTFTAPFAGNKPFVTGSSADIAFSTTGLGLIYHWNSNVKITGYYEMVKNETSNASKLTTALGTTNYSKDLKDDVYTIRVQYKF
jgi:hypothetical protein